MSKKGLTDSLNYGPLNRLDSEIWHVKISKNQFCETAWLELNGIIYRPTSVLKLYTENENPVFCEVNKIFIDHTDNYNFYFNCVVLETIGFNDHLKAYKVVKKDEYKLLKLKEFESSLPTIIHEVTPGQYFIDSQ